MTLPIADSPRRSLPALWRRIRDRIRELRSLPWIEMI